MKPSDKIRSAFHLRALQFLLLLLGAGFPSHFALGQITSLGGYTKFLANHNVLSRDIPEPLLNLAGFESNYTDYQIHNRINFTAQPGPFEIKLSLRNRVLWGYQASNNPTFNTQLESDPAGFDLSSIWLKSNGVLFHSVIDRLNVRWSNTYWEVKLGRQRMNWGMHTIWNPNDLFNTYNYLDFDYEERPGSDALQVTRYLGALSEVSVAAAVLDNNQWAAAGLFKTHVGNYDLQGIAGLWRQQWVLGGGFAGDLSSGSLKGECSVFLPQNASVQATLPPAVSASLGYEWSFDGGLFLSGNILYNSEGTANSSFFDLIQQNTSTTVLNNARLLFPFRTTYFVALGGPINPLLRLDGGVMTDASFDQLIAISTLSYSLAQNIDISLVSQVFLGDLDLTALQPLFPWVSMPNKDFTWLNGAFFLRVKHSF